MRKHVLILSCAAKVSLVRAFKAAAHARGVRVYGADLMDLAPALAEADERVILPAWHDADYAQAIADVCKAHQVGLLVPTSDGEMLPLAEIKDFLHAEGTAVLLPKPDTLAICQDKSKFVKFCQEKGFPIPRTYLGDVPETAFPVFIRPRTAQGGQGAMRVESASLLQALNEKNHNLLVQEYLDNPEYSIDLLMDLQGAKALQAVPRRRLQVYGGESQVSQTECNDELVELVMQLGEALQLVGHNVVQAFYAPSSGSKLIEVNPRFGGASVLSIRAGLDSPARILDLLNGHDSASHQRDIHYGLTMQRYSEDRFVDSG